MAIGATDPVLMQTAVFLTGAVIAVPVAQFLRLGSIIGYLTAGAVIGQIPMMRSADGVLDFAEYGVVLLLFVIGLELKPSRLWRLRTEVFGLGLAQVAVTGCAVGAALWAIGFAWQGALAVAAALALSSTAFGVQILREKGHLNAPYGDRAFSILLFQDIAVVPLFAMVAILAPGAEPGSGGSGYEQTLIAVAAVGGLLVAGRYLLRPVFHAIAIARASEAFTAAALLVVVGAALAMQVAGLSMALGAFVAGVLLAETEYRHQIETDIEPFRGLFLGLFFIGIGMGIDWPLVGRNIALVLGGALALFAVKGLLLYGLTRLRGSAHADALRIAAVLGQGGEFGLVIFGVAGASRLIPADDATLLTALVAVSMALTPFAVLLADRAIARHAEDGTDGLAGVEEAPAGQIIVAGFGRIGQVVARILRLRGYQVTLIDSSPRQIRLAETFGNKVLFGDGTRVDVMRMAGAAEARAIFLCIDDREGAKVAAERLRHTFPGTPIFATTYDRFSAIQMEKAGVTAVVRETVESAIALAATGLRHLGDATAIEDTIEEFRRRDEELLRLQVEFGAVEGLRRLREGYTISD